MADFVLSSEDRQLLDTWLADPATSNRLRTRARVVVALAEGLADREVARQCGVARQTVSLWRRRVQQAATVRTILADAPGRGRKPLVAAGTRAAVCEAHDRARRAGRPRSVRDLAREFGLSAATVHRTLKAGRLRGELAAPGDSGQAAGPWPVDSGAGSVTPGDPGIPAA
jgi:transposase